MAKLLWCYDSMGNFLKQKNLPSIFFSVAGEHLT
jgi:hypothetical protein